MIRSQSRSAGPAPATGPGTEWLSVAQIKAVYGLSRSSLNRLKAHVAWSNQPGVGLRFYKPDLEAYIASGRQEPVARKLPSASA